NSGNRFPLDRAVAVVWLPAQEENGVQHVHGFLRVPAAAAGGELALMANNTNGRLIQVLAPPAVRHFTAFLRRRSGRMSCSPHFHHGDEATRLVKSVADDRQQFDQKLDYLLRPGREVRSWDLLDWAPKRIW